MFVIPESLRASITPISSSHKGGRLTLRTWLLIVLIPVLIMALCTAAFVHPEKSHNTAQAAVVNNDEPVIVNGQTLPLGRQLAAELTHADNSAYTWILTDQQDAREGLANGTYAATVTIPKNFSEKITASAQATTTGDISKVAQGLITLDTSSATGVLDPTSSTNSANRVRAELDNLILTSYLENVYSGFTTMHTGISTAADGATDLHNGIGQLRDGISQLMDGSGQLVDGADQLATGLEDAAKQTESLPQSTRQLADGAQQVADGNQQIADTVTPIAKQAITVIDSSPSAHDIVNQLQPLLNQCQSSSAPSKLCLDISDALDQARSYAQVIDNAKTDARSAIVSARDSLNQLSSGAQQVADGARQLADATPALQSGIASAATGARQLADGSVSLDTGLTQVSNGTTALDDGSKQLSDGLNGALKQIPTFSQYASAKLADTVAQPSRITVTSPDIGTMTITFLATLALWGLALTTYVFTRALPDDILISREPTWKLIARSMLPGTLMAITGATAIAIITWIVLGLDTGRGLGLLAVAILTAFAFGSMNHALAGSFGVAGRIVSVVIMTLSVATGIISTVPGWLSSIAPMMPTHAATMIMRATVIGTSVSGGSVATLVAWWLAGFAVAILVTARQRRLDPRQLRPIR